MKLIAAVDENWGIGYKGQLLFDIPEDMKNFSKVTKEAGVVVMGRKTFESIGKLLPGRINIILTRNGIDYIPKESESDIEYYALSSFENVMDFLKSNNLMSKTFIIGGWEIYTLFADYCSSAIITKVNTKVQNVDSYMFDLDSYNDWKLISQSELKIHKELNYTFNEYINFSVKKY